MAEKGTALDDIKERARLLTLKRMKEAEDEEADREAETKSIQTRRRASEAKEAEVVKK